MSLTIVDKYGNGRIALNTLGGESVSDPRPSAVNLALLNAEVLMDIAGEEFSSVDVRGTFVGTMIPSFTVDGTNWVALPVFNRITESFQQGITAVGVYQVEIPTGAKRIRLVMTAYTSGTAIVSMTSNVGNAMLYVKPFPANLSVTATGVAGATVTATLPAVAGMFHYISCIRIDKFASALLTAGATPILVTTTNLNGARVYSVDASAQAQGTIVSTKDNEIPPIKSSTAGSATTFVCPVATGVIWRVTIDYYLGF